MVRKAQSGDVNQIQLSLTQFQINGSIQSLKKARIIGGVQNTAKLFECSVTEKNNVFPGTTSIESHNLFFPD